MLAGCFEAEQRPTPSVKWPPPSQSFQCLHARPLGPKNHWPKTTIQPRVKLVNIEVTAALVGALSGAVASYAVVVTQDKIRAWRIRYGLEFTVSPLKDQSVGGRVKNNSPYPIKNCWAYVSLQFEPEDILNQGKVFITAEAPSQLDEDRLCWSISGNPSVIDICPGENQALNIADFAPSRACFWIVSEKNNHPYRVCLTGGKSYKGFIKIVNFESTAKCFSILIDPRNVEKPIKITPN